MDYSLSYERKGGGRQYDGAREIRGKVIDASITDKEWLIENPNQITKIPGVTYCLGFHKPELIQQAIREQIPFMIEEPVQDWERLWFLISYIHVSQVRISGELLFDISRVSKLCHENNVLVRILDPHLPSSHHIELNPLEKGFIIPTGIKYIEDYVDIIEFSDVTRERTLINTYIYFQKWLGDLDLLTEGAFKGINATALPEDLMRRRIRCQRSCLKGSNCRFCNKAFELAELLGKHKLSLEEEE